MSKKKTVSTSQTAKVSESCTYDNLEIPEFWKDNAALWFHKLEAIFRIKQITLDETKFSYVVSKLDSKSAKLVEDIITRPTTAKNKYDAIKFNLINRSSVLNSNEQHSESAKSAALKKGSQNNSDIDDVRDELMRLKLEVDQLTLKAQNPQGARAQTQSHTQAPSQSYAQAPSQSYAPPPSQSYPPPPSQSYAQTPSQSYAQAQSQSYTQAPSQSYAQAPSQSYAEDPCQMFMRALSAACTQAHSKPGDVNNRGRSPSESSEEEDEDICWYHMNYGSAAYRCESPCAWDN